MHLLGFRLSTFLIYFFITNSGVFVGPDIRKLMIDTGFEQYLTEPEKRAWRGVRDVVNSFLGNYRSPFYREMIKEMLDAYHALKVNMSLKVHFMHSHLDFFPENMGDVSDEHGERFHQDVEVIEQRFKGKSIPSMMADYCWALVYETTADSYNRQSKRRRTLSTNSK